MNGRASLRPGSRRGLVPALLALAAGVLAACGPAPAPSGWQDRLFEEGRALFYRTVRDGIAVHPDRARLTSGEILKITEAETRYPRLYGLLTNVFYVKDELIFAELMKKGDRASAEEFSRMYRDTVTFAARQFIEAFFLTDWSTDHVRKINPKYKDLDAVDLVVRSMGYDAKLDPPPARTSPPALSPEFEKQHALDGARFRGALALARGKGARIAILDTGIDPTHPVFARTSWGNHFSLVGREGPPWSAQASLVDWGWHGTLITSVAAVYAPEARLTVYKFGDGDTQNDPAYQLLMECMVAAAVYRAIHDGNDVISISASGASLDADYLRQAIRYAYEQNRVVVSGNLYSKWAKQGAVLNFPGQYSTVISVTAAQPRPGGGYAYWDICAPDETTGVAAPNDIFGAFPTYVGEKDTYIPSISAAIPVVSSLFALAVSVYPRTGTEAPGAYADTLMNLVRDNADPAAVGYTGFTPECGHGLVDAEKTVRAAMRLAAARGRS